MDPLLLASNVSQILVEDWLCKSYTGMNLFLLLVTAISRRAEVQEVELEVLSQVMNTSLAAL